MPIGSSHQSRRKEWMEWSLMTKTPVFSPRLRTIYMSTSCLTCDRCFQTLRAESREEEEADVWLVMVQFSFCMTTLKPCVRLYFYDGGSCLGVLTYWSGHLNLRSYMTLNPGSNGCTSRKRHKNSRYSAFAHQSQQTTKVGCWAPIEAATRNWQIANDHDHDTCGAILMLVGFK